MKLFAAIAFIFFTVHAYAQSSVTSESPVNVPGVTMSPDVNSHPSQKNSEVNIPEAVTAAPVPMSLFSSKEDLVKHCTEKNIDLRLQQSEKNLKAQREIGYGIAMPVFKTKEEFENYCREHNISLSLTQSNVTVPAVKPASATQPSIQEKEK